MTVGRACRDRRRTSRPSSAASPSAAWRCSRPTPSTASPPSRTRARASSASTGSRAAAPDRPAAVMFFRLELALAALPELGDAHARRARAAAARARVTLLLPNPARRFPLACGPEPERLGLRVPRARGRARAAGRRAAGPCCSRAPTARGGADARQRRRRRRADPRGRRPGPRRRRAARHAVDGRRPDRATRTTAASRSSARAPCRARSSALGVDGALLRCCAMSELSPDYFTKPVADVDPEIAEVLENEAARQETTLEMIASENFVPQAILDCQGSVLTNKYAEGYPGKRYYGGCEYVDVAEQLAIDRAKELFGAEHVNVQPHSGRAGQLGRLHGAARARRPHPRHEARPRRPPHARDEDQLLRALLRHRRLRRARGGLAARHGRARSRSPRTPGRS